MKRILTFAALAFVFVACQKTKTVTEAEPAPVPKDPKPTASFRISNANEVGGVIELRKLVFENTSKDAVMYSWDLSESANYFDGVVDQPLRYTAKAVPENIYMIPCMKPVTIILTAINKAGETDTAMRTYDVQCFRGVGGKHPEMHKLY